MTRTSGIQGLLALSAIFLASALVVGESHDARRSAGPSPSESIVWKAASIRLEVPNDPPVGTFVLLNRGTSPAMVATRGLFTSVQVNVNANGFNIVGDAANEPSIAVDPTDRTKMAIGWRQFDSILSDFRQAGNAYSADGGQTWTFPGVLDPGQFRSDPVLASDADGVFFYSSLSSLSSIEVFRSLDGGMSWGPPKPAFGGDKQWIAVDRTDGIGRGNVYQIWNVQFSCCVPNDFTRTTNRGLSYQGPFPVNPPSMKWGTMDVGPNGTLYLAGNELNSFNGQLFTKSTNAKDPGQTPTFDVSRSIDLGGVVGFGGGVNPGGLLGQTWVATDHSDGPTRGNIYVLGSVVPPAGDPLDVMFIRSTDNGVTWSAPLRINDDPSGNGAWQWFGTMSVAPIGRIDVIWNDTRNDPGGFMSEVFYSSSMDGGLTWSANEPISPAFDPSLGWPIQQKIGDYYDMISDNTGASLAYAATFNGEQDVYFLRIELDCNNNGVSDELDVSTGASNDCNGNLVPDECEPDCDGNAEPDTCDIANGLLDDLDGDGVPDTCDGPAILLVPVDATGPHTINGNEIALQAGQFAEFEIQVGNWDSDLNGTPLLSSWFAEIDPAGYSSGDEGMLLPAWPICESSADCQASVHPLSTCGFANGVSNRCQPVVIDTSRPDYVFAGVQDFPAIDPSKLTLRIASIVLIGGVEDPGVPLYTATVVLDIPSDARGTFTFGFNSEGNVTDEVNQVISPLTFVPARITVAPPECDGVNNCTENGTCVGPDVCDCNFGWTGTECAQITCNVQDDCSGNGTCVGPNICDCFEGWSGAKCTIPLCDGQDDCSGNGACIAPDVCECDAGWSGDTCATAICTGVNDCSGHGVCVAPDVCDCDSGWIGSDCSTAALGEVALVPTGADGIYRRNQDEITVTPGQVVYLEIRVANWDRDLTGSPMLSAMSVQVDSSTWSSGSQGVLIPFTPPCSTDAECQTAVHRASTCAVTKQCTAGFIDDTRSDYVFAAVSNTSAVDLLSPDPVFTALSTGAAVTDPGTSTYAGTLALLVSNDAAGTFEVAASASPAVTFLSDEGAVSLEPLEFLSAKITVTDEELYSRKNRFLTIRAGRPDHQEAIRVTAADLTGDISAFNGTKLWVGEPAQLSERTDKGLGDPLDPGEPFTWVAALQCDAFFTDWTQFPEPIHVYHELVTPASVYDVQTLDDAFDPTGAEENFSQPVTLFTPRWGDVTQVFDAAAGVWEPPGTNVNIQVDILDVLAMVSAFQGSSTAPIKARWDLQGLGTGIVDGTIDILDIFIDVSAFSGVPYPYLPSGPPCP